MLPVRYPIRRVVHLSAERCSVWRAIVVESSRWLAPFHGAPDSDACLAPGRAPSLQRRTRARPSLVHVIDSTPFDHLTFRMDAPPPIAAWMRDARREHTHVDIRLCPTTVGTSVFLEHWGWGDGRSWLRARAWCAMTWDDALETLRVEIEQLTSHGHARTTLSHVEASREAIGAGSGVRPLALGEGRDTVEARPTLSGLGTGDDADTSLTG